MRVLYRNISNWMHDHFTREHLVRTVEQSCGPIAVADSRVHSGHSQNRQPTDNNYCSGPISHQQEVQPDSGSEIQQK